MRPALVLTAARVAILESRLTAIVRQGGPERDVKHVSLEKNIIKMNRTKAISGHVVTLFGGLI